MARPKSVISQETFDSICDELSCSDKSLKSICKEKGVVSRYFYEMINESEELRNKYARARESQADYLADQIIEIADEDAGINPMTGGTDTGKVQQNRLRVEARKWIASKLKPKKYGEKVDVTTDGKEIKGSTIIWGGREVNV